MCVHGFACVCVDGMGWDGMARDVTHPSVCFHTILQAYAASRLWKPRDEVAQQIDAILTNHIMTDEKEREMQREEGKEGEKTKGSKVRIKHPAH